MVSSGGKGKRFFSTLLILISFFMILSTLFIAIWRILLWEVLNPYLQVYADRLIHLLDLPVGGFIVNVATIMPFLSQVIIVAVVLYLGINNRLVRRKEFWLMSIPLLAVLILAISSQFWSLNAATTVKRFWFLFAVAMGGLFIGLEIYRSRIVIIFEVFAVFLVVLSYVIVFRYPTLGIMTFDAPGAWRGVLNYKNFAGQMISFAALMFLFRLANFKNERWIVRLYSLSFLLLSIFFLVKTQNKTAMGTFLIIIFLLLLSFLYIKWGALLKSKHWWIIGACAGIGLLLFWIGRNAFWGFLGMDGTLNGRVPIWAAQIPFIKQKLLFGYGFGEVFWYSPYLEEFWKIAPWKAGLSHSGYMEALIDTGLIGFIFWIAFLMITGYFSLKYFIDEKALYALIFLAWFVQVIINNVTENLLGTYEAFYFLLLVISFAATVRTRLYKEERPKKGDPVT
jgi:O-antigen ligase